MGTQVWFSVNKKQQSSHLVRLHSWFRYFSKHSCFSRIGNPQIIIQKETHRNKVGMTSRSDHIFVEVVDCVDFPCISPSSDRQGARLVSHAMSVNSLICLGSHVARIMIVVLASTCSQPPRHRAFGLRQRSWGNSRSELRRIRPPFGLELR